MEGEEERIQEESQPHRETISGNAVKEQAEGRQTLLCRTSDSMCAAPATCMHACLIVVIWLYLVGGRGLLVAVRVL